MLQRVNYVLGWMYGVLRGTGGSEGRQRRYACNRIRKGQFNESDDMVPAQVQVLKWEGGAKVGFQSRERERKKEEWDSGSLVE